MPLGFQAELRAAAPPKIPVILDTDLDSDVDEVFALALILGSPELDLRGITTVSGNTKAVRRAAEIAHARNFSIGS
jgi:inosine-uridine nucleoside N-ribohydrolase